MEGVLSLFGIESPSIARREEMMFLTLDIDMYGDTYGDTPN